MRDNDILPLEGLAEEPLIQLCGNFDDATIEYLHEHNPLVAKLAKVARDILEAVY
jgi:hypothetical protein